MPDTVTLILTTVPDAASAEVLENLALADRLAACVTRLAPATSSYHWQGRIEHAEEIPMLFKTTAVLADKLAKMIASHHPYDTPEILVWAATASPAYGRWVADETGKPLHV